MVRRQMYIFNIFPDYLQAASVAGDCHWACTHLRGHDDEWLHRRTSPYLIPGASQVFLWILVQLLCCCQSYCAIAILVWRTDVHRIRVCVSGDSQGKR